MNLSLKGPLNSICKKTIQFPNLVDPSGKLIRRDRVFGTVWIFSRYHTHTSENLKIKGGLKLYNFHHSQMR